MKEREEQRGKVKQSLFPVSLFGIYIGVLFLMSGIHTGLIVFMNSAGWNKVVMTVVPMCYWGMFPVSLFGIYIGVLFLMSGIHTGLIVFMNSAGWNKVVMTVVPMCYWGMVAMGLTLFTRW